MTFRRLLCTADCLLLTASLSLSVAPSALAGAGMAPDPSKEIGVLVLAHGGSDRWNRVVQETVAQAQIKDPTEIAFGMAMHPHEVAAIQRAVRKLEGRGIKRLVVVPLLISSASEVMRQYQYVLGLRDHGPWEKQVERVSVHVPLVMTPPLDDDPVVSEVLLERAKALSRTSKEEAVVLIAHGPNEDPDNAQWLEVMGRVAARLKAMGHFREVVPVTLRDDASKPVQEAATKQIRELIRQQNEQGRTLVIPLLLANGGIEAKISQRLKGLSYVYRGAALLPHPKVAQWIASRVEWAASQAGIAPRTDGGNRPAAPVAEPGHL